MLVRVKIVRCWNERDWYKNYIGSVFKVIQHKRPTLWTITLNGKPVKGSDGVEYSLVKTDCVILPNLHKEIIKTRRIRCL